MTPTDNTPSDTPPRRRRSSASESAPKPRTEDKTPTPGKPIGVLQKKLEALLASFALPFMAAGDNHCASIVAHRAPVVAEAWSNLAAESPAVKRVLESMLKGGAWSGAIVTTLVTVVPIAAHHGVAIPDFVSPVLFGRETEGGDEHRTEQPPPVSANGSANGNGTPGPAAASVQPEPDADAADPGRYAGN